MLGVSFYIFKKSEKTVLNMFFTTACIIIFTYSFFDYLQMMILQKDSFDVFNYFSITAIVLIVYILKFRHRYKWERQKSDDYNKDKIQKIFKKIITIFKLQL